jgi:hypothetical protein
MGEMESGQGTQMKSCQAQEDRFRRITPHHAVFSEKRFGLARDAAPESKMLAITNAPKSMALTSEAHIGSGGDADGALTLPGWAPFATTHWKQLCDNSLKTEHYNL